jgi:hypothetical protein
MYLCDPEILNATGVAYIEPRILFDCAVEKIEDNGDIKKVFYNAARVEEICKQRYSNRVFQRLQDQLKGISEIVALV